jgi:hypothetical protein
MGKLGAGSMNQDDKKEEGILSTVQNTVVDTAQAGLSG